MLDYEELLRRAKAPSIRTLEQLAVGVSDSTLRILKAIRDGFSEPGFTLARLRKIARVGNSAVQRFIREVGISPSKLVWECRMETALRLLRDTSLPVETVAGLVCYSAAPAFITSCIDWCGVTPARLRQCTRRLERLLPEVGEKILQREFLERQARRELEPEDLRPIAERLSKGGQDS